MLISDWSSDVCSSDLVSTRRVLPFLSASSIVTAPAFPSAHVKESKWGGLIRVMRSAQLAPTCERKRSGTGTSSSESRSWFMVRPSSPPHNGFGRAAHEPPSAEVGRSDERRGGKEWDSTGRSRGGPKN